MIKIQDNFIIIETLNNALVFEIKRYYFDNVEYNNQHPELRYIIQRYYGPKKDMIELTPSICVAPPAGSTWDFMKDPLISSSFGNGNNTEVSVLISNSDNSFTNRFLFKEAKIIKGGVDIFGPHARDAIETLDIIEYDEHSKIELHNYYSFYENTDIIVAKKKIVNLGDKDITLNRLMSLELPIMNRKMEVYTFDGAWLSERQRRVIKLESGTVVNQSLSGYSSHKHNPFFEVLDTESGLLYGFNLIYSGNHKGIVDINPIEHTSVMIGVNDYCFQYLIKAKDGEFITPEALFMVATDRDTLTHQMHDFANKHIINPNFAYKERPVLFNSWEGSTFSINEKNLIEMAEVCKDLGIELFVIDDGWFKGRDDDSSSLGDWVADERKFPKGIGYIADKIRNLGLKFGIWVEPEMISMKSDLFRNHPEYAMMSKDRFPLERRRQLMIDLTNKEVVDYLFDSLSNVINETKADYVKWDFNRFIVDMYSSIGIRCGEFFHRYVLGLYDLLERLVKAFPNLLIEGCSSGGGRFDLGISYYFPQTWGSDNSNSDFRLKIASGTFEGYPISTFGAHVAHEYKNNKTYYFSSLEDRFNIQAFGAFGYEFDVRNTNDEEKATIRDQIKYFKKHRALFVYGDYYNIDNIFENDQYCSFQVVSKDKTEAILLVAELNKDVPSKKWKFKQLLENATYEIEVRHQHGYKDIIVAPLSGKELMEEGVDLGKISLADSESEGYQSRLVYIKKI